jgi:apolipoprotein D and lipocalin family protein
MQPTRPPRRIMAAAMRIAGSHHMKARLLSILAVSACLACGGAGAQDRPAASPGSPSSAPSTAPLTAVDTLDVQRYLGTWHEIARYPNWFQRKCVGQVTADYALDSDGSLKVLNRCRQANDEFDEAKGTALQQGGTTSARLKVSFAPAWLSFIPFLWGDYWVIDIDADYQLAAVSEPGRDYLWVLSKTPRVDPARYQALLERLAAKGFDLTKIELTPQ